MPQNYWPEFKDQTNEKLLSIMCESAAPSSEKMEQLLGVLKFRTEIAQIEAASAQKEAAIAATKSADATKKYTRYTFWILIATSVSIVANTGVQLYMHYIKT